MPGIGEQFLLLSILADIEQNDKYGFPIFSAA